jgi:hypothetical protein
MEGPVAHDEAPGGQHRHPDHSSDPGPAKPGPAKPGPAKPGPAKPGPAKPGPAKPGPAKPGTQQRALNTVLRSFPRKHDEAF